VPIPSTAELESALDHLRDAPSGAGRLTLVVRRPERLAREVLDQAVVDEADGLVGDNWLTRATSRAVAAGRHLDAQITVMSARMVGLLGDTDAERALAGDQLYVDLDLSLDNLPAGTRLAIGSAVIEVSDTPHTGCAKFSARFGGDAQRWVNSPVGRDRRLRGMNARIVQAGTVRAGDSIRKV
jgi:MOSC domain-containing protein YiiM